MCLSIQITEPLGLRRSWVQDMNVFEYVSAVVARNPEICRVRIVNDDEIVVMFLDAINAPITLRSR